MGPPRVQRGRAKRHSGGCRRSGCWSHVSSLHPLMGGTGSLTWRLGRCRRSGSGFAKAADSIVETEGRITSRSTSTTPSMIRWLQPHRLGCM